MKYSRFIVSLALLSASYGTYSLYVESMIIWILSALSLLLSFMALLVGANTLLTYFISPQLPEWFSRLLLRFSSIGMFLTSIYGTIKLLSNLYVHDLSQVVIPILILSILFAGASIGLFQHSE